jgi:prophage regulatory protein
MEILRVEEVANYLSLSKATIYRLIKSGDFPPSIKLSTRRVGWKKETVDAWLDKLMAQDAA